MCRGYTPVRERLEPQRPVPGIRASGEKACAAATTASAPETVLKTVSVTPPMTVLRKLPAAFPSDSAMASCGDGYGEGK